MTLLSASSIDFDGCTRNRTSHAGPFFSAQLRSRCTNARVGASTCAFDPIPAGTYAVACFHDENKNGRLDTGLFGIPTEGTVVSNHAKGFMGPPSFEKARFTFAGVPSELQLRMGY